MATLTFNSANKDIWLSKIMDYKNCVHNEDCENVVLTFPNIEAAYCRGVRL